MIYTRSWLNRFRVGDLFEYICGDNTKKIGWVVGLALNSSNEVIFLVKYADKPEEECSLHPMLMKPLLDYIPGVNS